MLLSGSTSSVFLFFCLTTHKSPIFLWLLLDYSKEGHSKLVGAPTHIAIITLEKVIAVINTKNMNKNTSRPCFSLETQGAEVRYYPKLSDVLF